MYKSKYLFYQLSFRSSVVSITCCFVQVSFWSNPVLIKCRFNQVSFWLNVVSITCRFNQLPFRSSVVWSIVVQSINYRSTVVPALWADIVLGQAFIKQCKEVIFKLGGSKESLIMAQLYCGVLPLVSTSTGFFAISSLDVNLI